MKQLYRVKIGTGLVYECLGSVDIKITPGMHAVVQCERYVDYVQLESAVGEPIENEEEFERERAAQTKGRHVEGQRVPQMIRIATPEDDAVAKDNEVRAFDAHNKTMERIKAHMMEMKLIFTHYSYDRKLLLFQFSADGRIDFRELLRDLSGLFHARIELRQIGVRDEAAILGGIGTCGRPLCCSAFLPSFNSINVKMAKTQGISLTPQNISGCCGRLKCCLAYEAEYYKEVRDMLKARQEEAASTAEEEKAQVVIPLRPDAMAGKSAPSAAPQRDSRENNPQSSQQQPPRRNNHFRPPQRPRDNNNGNGNQPQRPHDNGNRHK